MPQPGAPATSGDPATATAAGIAASTAPAPSPWVLSNEPASVGEATDVLMLVEGQAFCVSGRNGDVAPDTARGVFFADVRVIDRIELRIDGEPLEPLAVSPTGAYAATIVARTRGHGHPTPLLVLRRRTIGLVLTEEIEVRNHAPGVVRCAVQLAVGCDFADLFAVKEGRTVHEGAHSVEVTPDALVFGWHLQEAQRRVRVHFAGCSEDADGSGGGVAVGPHGAVWNVEVPPKGSCTVSWDVDVAIGDAWVRRPEAAHADEALGTRRFERWRAAAPSVACEHERLTAAVEKAIDDVGALRLFDPDGRRLPVIAAGAPWFMTLFGRDALLTATMALPLDPTLALGVLRSLAELQGVKEDPRSEEQPGRILHETRFGASTTLALDSGSTYYGSVDATPLFVALLGELSRWGLPEAELRALLPNADRALSWIEDYGDRDGDGFVEYQRMTERGLANQGWKDSWDGVRHRDGSVARPPIALAEVQGYVYAAFRARADIARRMGNGALADRYERKARDLKAAFLDAFWIDELGWVAMGLDADKRQIGALASNMGHCLWSGLLDGEHARRVGEHLAAGPLWSGWGVRTMAADEVAYDPLSYHCGSVWPHDSALIAAGLAKTGSTEAFHRVALALLDASASWQGRLPELFCGLDRDDVPVPVPFPTSCSPQAWAAASPLLLLRALLGFDPDVPRGVVRIAPALPAAIDAIGVRGLRLWDRRLDVRVEAGSAGSVRVDGLEDLRLEGG